MKKIFLLALVFALCFSFAACAPATPTTTEIPDLTGEWKQVTPKPETAYQSAFITGETIEIYWVDEEEGTKALYWAGTYIAPDKAEDSYTWDSVNDKEKTDAALLASGGDTKTFTYANGQLSYEVSAMGVTQTIKLEKQ